MYWNAVMRSLISTALLAIGATASSPTLSAQTLLRTYQEAYDASLVGYFDVVGDIDGDGWNELIAGSGNANYGGLFEAGVTKVLDGQTGEVVYSFEGIQAGYNLGFNVIGPGDMNGDKIPDLAATADVFGQHGYVWSGADGSLLANVGSFFSGDQLGDINRDGLMDLVHGGGRIVVTLGGTFEEAYSVSSPSPAALLYGWQTVTLGDVDGDRLPDFAVSAPGSTLKAFCSFGHVFVYSGADGDLLYELQGPAGDSLFGTNMAAPGDINGDDVPDLVVTAPWCCADCFGRDTGRIFFFDGPTGTLLHSFGLEGTLNQVELLGDFSATALGDLNGNGYGDVLAPYIRRNEGAELVALEGSTGEPIYSTPIPLSGSRCFGGTLRAAGDVNGDDFPDFYSSIDCVAIDEGHIDLYSGAPQGVRTFGEPCSHPAGNPPRIGASGVPRVGTTFTCYLSQIHANQEAFLLIGSPIGTSGAFPLPLVFGLAGKPGCQLLAGPGRTRAATPLEVRPGEGVARIDLPIPNDPSLVGTKLMMQWIVRGRSLQGTHHGAYRPVKWATTRVLEITVQG